MAPTDSPQPVVRPPFLIALGAIVLGGLLAGAYVYGRQSAAPSLSSADVAALQSLHELGSAGRGAPILGAVRSDDERVRLAIVVELGLASDIATSTEALLLQADETVPEGDRNAVFNRSGWTELSQAERDEAFRSECVAWADQVVDAANDARGLSGRLQPLVTELAAQAEELKDLCRPA